MTLRIDAFAPDDHARLADWHTVRDALACAVPDEPLPDGARCLVAYCAGRPLARLALEWKEEMTGAPGRSGLIGWYEAADAEAGVALLRRAQELLAGGGAVRMLGPINGGTWARYRLALPDPETRANRAFLTEPQNPAGYPAHFEAAGFAPVLEYESRLVARGTPAAEGMDAARERLRDAGVRVRGLDLAAYDAELRAIFDLSLAAFAGNPLYTPISFLDFRAMYDRVRPLLDPSLVRLAHDADGRLLAFVFALPDALADPAQPRIVLKTLATAPEARGLGLGTVLTAEIDRLGAERGAHVIHALMHVSNASMRISAGARSTLFRRYALYGA
jgi:ribosomal protein S18 acetylase RimI-like enzyme